MMKIKGNNGKAVVGIPISYWSCLHREAYSLTRRERYGRKKNLSINLPPPSWFAIQVKATYLIREFGWRNEAWADEQTLFFLSRCPESRMYTFSSFFMCWLFIPIGSLQLARLGLMHLILVEGINKPKQIQSHFPVHLYIKVPFDLHLLYFYIYFSDVYKFGWGNTGCN